MHQAMVYNPPSTDNLQSRCKRLEFVDLIVDQVVDLRVQTSWETLLSGELIKGRVNHGVLHLVVASSLGISRWVRVLLGSLAIHGVLGVLHPFRHLGDC